MTTEHWHRNFNCCNYTFFNLFTWFGLDLCFKYQNHPLLLYFNTGWFAELKLRILHTYLQIFPDFALMAIVCYSIDWLWWTADMNIITTFWWYDDDDRSDFAQSVHQVPASVTSGDSQQFVGDNMVLATSTLGLVSSLSCAFLCPSNSSCSFPLCNP